MAHFDTAFDLQHALAIRAWIACDHITNVSHFRGRYVAIPVDAEEVFTINVGTGREIAHCRNGTVNHYRDRHIDRAERAWTGIHHRADFCFGREGQWAGNLWQFFCLNFVQFVIATHQQGNQRVAAAFNRFHQQRLNGFFNRQIELLNQLSNGFGVRRINQRHRFSGCRAWRSGCQGFSKLDVGRVIRGVREDHIIFAALRQHLEFMGCATADGTGIGLYSTEIQTHTGEDFAVRVVHLVIGLLQ